MHSSPIMLEQFTKLKQHSEDPLVRFRGPITNKIGISTAIFQQSQLFLQNTPLRERNMLATLNLVLYSHYFLRNLRECQRRLANHLGLPEHLVKHILRCLIHQFISLGSIYKPQFFEYYPILQINHILSSVQL